MKTTVVRMSHHQRRELRSERHDLQQMFDAVLKATIGPPLPDNPRRVQSIKRKFVGALVDAYDALAIDTEEIG